MEKLNYKEANIIILDDNCLEESYALFKEYFKIEGDIYIQDEEAYGTDCYGFIKYNGITEDKIRSIIELEREYKKEFGYALDIRPVLVLQFLWLKEYLPKKDVLFTVSE